MGIPDRNRNRQSKAYRATAWYHSANQGLPPSSRDTLDKATNDLHTTTQTISKVSEQTDHISSLAESAKMLMKTWKTIPLCPVQPTLLSTLPTLTIYANAAANDAHYPAVYLQPRCPQLCPSYQKQAIYPRKTNLHHFQQKCSRLTQEMWGGSCLCTTWKYEWVDAFSGPGNWSSVLND